MSVDSLAPLLTHFNARANLFFTGNLCADATFGEEHGLGFLHLFRSGKTALRDNAGHDLTLVEPTLVFYSRPVTHWFAPDASIGADLACASVTFENKTFNPIALALPARFHCLLSEMRGAEALLSCLFAEAFAERPGRQEVLNRLFEVLLIELLRITIARDGDSVGFLRALSHPQLSRALNAIHAEPARAWSLEAMAELAGMSRSSFATAFKEAVAETPGEYLTRWRMAIAQAELKKGTPLKLVGERVGYESQAGFLRAFKLVVGVPPTEWLKAQAR